MGKLVTRFEQGVFYLNLTWWLTSIRNLFPALKVEMGIHVVASYIGRLQIDVHGEGTMHARIVLVHITSSNKRCKMKFAKFN